MTKTISQLTNMSGNATIDRAADFLEITDTSAVVSYKATPNFILGITGNPVGTTDLQTLTNKTLTAPTISGPTLSGTILGTYTLGGTPTFPAAVVTLTGSQTLTNKVLTAPTINNGSITGTTITTDAIVGQSASTTGTVYGVSVTTGFISGSVLTAGTVGSSQVATGMPVQMVSTNFSAVATGTTVIPADDTIPQNTEGDQYMTQAITPKSATNRLSIEVTIVLSTSGTVGDITVALFQDSTANALAAAVQTYPTALYIQNMKLMHDMVAGTTSSTTFKIRAGSNVAGTTTFNGQSGARTRGGITLSNIRVTEYKV